MKATVTDKMVADVVEALLGSIYLEAGWAAARRFFDDFILRQDSAPATPAACWPHLAIQSHQRGVRAQVIKLDVEKPSPKPQPSESERKPQTQLPGPSPDPRP